MKRLQLLALALAFAPALATWADPGVVGYGGAAAAPNVAPITTQTKVLILPFTSIHDGGVSDAWIGKAIEQNILIDLAKQPRFQPMMFSEKGGQGAPGGLFRAAGRTGVVVYGSYQVIEGQVRISAEVVDVNTGALLGSAKATGSVHDLLALEDSISDQVREAATQAGSLAAAEAAPTAPAATAQPTYSSTAYGPYSNAPATEEQPEYVTPLYDNGYTGYYPDYYYDGGYGYGYGWGYPYYSYPGYPFYGGWFFFGGCFNDHHDHDGHHHDGDHHSGNDHHWTYGSVTHGSTATHGSSFTHGATVGHTPAMASSHTFATPGVTSPSIHSGLSNPSFSHSVPAYGSTHVYSSPSYSHSYSGGGGTHYYSAPTSHGFSGGSGSHSSGFSGGGGGGGAAHGGSSGGFSGGFSGGGGHMGGGGGGGHR